MFIATLIANRGLARIVQQGTFDRLDWIDHDVAVDLSYAGREGYDVADRQSQEISLRDDISTGVIYSGWPDIDIDVVIQPEEHRLKRLLVADMDSTMITVECIDELADYAGLKAEVAAITERAMQGELDFEAALDARVRLLADMPTETIDRCRKERVRIMPGARTLVRTMKARGATCILVSGGFTRFADPVAAEIGFDRVVANVLEIEDDRLTGAVSRPIVGAAAKLQVLMDTAAELGIPLEETMAVGDGANDIPMIEAAGLGVAYHAKPAAAAAADARIEHNDLTALLYAQGIPRSEWVIA